MCVCADLQLGASAAVNLNEVKAKFQAAADYSINSYTQVKGLVDVNTANVGAADLSLAVEHRLISPLAAVGFASTYNIPSLVTGPIKASKFGFYATFGDY